MMQLMSTTFLILTRMKNLSVIALAVFCLAGSVLSDRPTPTKEQLAALEKLLAESSLEDQEAEFDDGPKKTLRKSWNPIAWIKNQFNNKCVCENNKCDCCFKLKVLANTTCLSVEQLVGQKAIQVVYKVDDNVLVDKKISTERNDQVCGPVPTLPFLKFCFTQQSEEEADHSITSCTSVDFRVGQTVGAVLQFRCLELKDGKISIGGYNEVEKSQALVVRVKNPFRAALDLYRKSAGSE